MPPKKIALPTKKGKAAPKGKGKAGAKKANKSAKKGKAPKKTKASKKPKGPPEAAKKEKGGKKAKPPAKASATADTDQPPDKGLEPTVDPTLLTNRDYLVIALLWGYELVFVVTEASKASFLQKHDDPAARKLTVDIIPRSFSSLVLMVLAVFYMMTVAVKVSGNGRVLGLFFGLMAYLATPIFGVLASQFLVTGFSEAMLWLQIGWHALNPVRFWLIFNQRFPLPVETSRIVVIANVFVIGVAKYVTSVFLIPSTFSYLVYTIVWSIIWALMAAWLFLIFWFRTFFNVIEDDIDVIADRYKKLEAEECFQARQTRAHIVLFSLLLCPSVIFSMLESAFTQLIRNHRDDLNVFANYRIDIIIGLISLLVFGGFLIAIGDVRNEIRDLIVITLSHFLSLLVLALLFFVAVTIVKPPPTPKPELEEHVHSFLSPDILDYGGLFLKDREPCYMKGWYAECHSQKGKEALLQGFSRELIEVFSFKDDFKATLTPWMLHFRKLYRIRNWGISPPANENERIAWAVSCLQPCPGQPSRNENGHTLFWYHSCRSLGTIVEFKHSKEGQSVSKPVLLDVPLITEGVTKSIPYPGGSFVKINYFLRSKFGSFNHSIVYFLSDKDVNFTKPDRHLEFTAWTATSNSSMMFSIAVKHPNFLLDFAYEPINSTTTLAPTTLKPTPPPNLPPKFEIGRTLLIAALAISAVPIGIATASYIHFIWIQSPWYDKTITLALYFGINHFGSWYARNYTSGQYNADFQTLIIFQLICLIWHVLALAKFSNSLRELTPKEKDLGDLMLF
ncbi:Hypothetical protein NTJ_10156 [Nesidiocoris tenuis]|uniref:Uncharacterized protein n=1 Tax=Nesidiocoris tenuis TaxID=355587 RepID=A0ABN7B3N3_9HEMI|nr:Hypothetical protein NTJ_10156 [Nesidiocoris tenuis]